MASPVPATTEPGLRRVIGVRGLAAAIFNITVGAAIFVLPAHMAASLGAAAPLAYLVCAVATALVEIGRASCRERVESSGDAGSCRRTGARANVGSYRHVELI